MKIVDIFKNLAIITITLLLWHSESLAQTSGSVTNTNNQSSVEVDIREIGEGARQQEQG